MERVTPLAESAHSGESAAASTPSTASTIAFRSFELYVAAAAGVNGPGPTLLRATACPHGRRERGVSVMRADVPLLISRHSLSDRYPALGPASSPSATPMVSPTSTAPGTGTAASPSQCSDRGFPTGGDGTSTMASPLSEEPPAALPTPRTVHAHTAPLLPLEAAPAPVRLSVAPPASSPDAVPEPRTSLQRPRPLTSPSSPHPGYVFPSPRQRSDGGDRPLPPSPAPPERTQTGSAFLRGLSPRDNASHRPWPSRAQQLVPSAGSSAPARETGTPSNGSRRSSRTRRPPPVRRRGEPLDWIRFPWGGSPAGGAVSAPTPSATAAEGLRQGSSPGDRPLPQPLSSSAWRPSGSEPTIEVRVGEYSEEREEALFSGRDADLLLVLQAVSPARQHGSSNNNRSSNPERVDHTPEEEEEQQQRTTTPAPATAFTVNRRVLCGASVFFEKLCDEAEADGRLPSGAADDSGNVEMSVGEESAVAPAGAVPWSEPHDGKANPAATSGTGLTGARTLPVLELLAFPLSPAAPASRVGADVTPPSEDAPPLSPEMLAAVLCFIYSGRVFLPADPWVPAGRVPPSSLGLCEDAVGARFARVYVGLLWASEYLHLATLTPVLEALLPDILDRLSVWPVLRESRRTGLGQLEHTCTRWARRRVWDLLRASRATLATLAPEELVWLVSLHHVRLSLRSLPYAEQSPATSSLPSPPPPRAREGVGFALPPPAQASATPPSATTTFPPQETERCLLGRPVAAATARDAARPHAQADIAARATGPLPSSARLARAPASLLSSRSGTLLVPTLPLLEMADEAAPPQPSPSLSTTVPPPALEGDDGGSGVSTRSPQSSVATRSVPATPLSQPPARGTATASLSLTALSTPVGATSRLAKPSPPQRGWSASEHPFSLNSHPLSPRNDTSLEGSFAGLAARSQAAALFPSAGLSSTAEWAIARRLPPGTRVLLSLGTADTATGGGCAATPSAEVAPAAACPMSEADVLHVVLYWCADWLAVHPSASPSEESGPIRQLLTTIDWTAIDTDASLPAWARDLVRR